MDAPDMRGAGGRAPRARVNANAGLIQLVTSPFKLFSKKGRVSNEPRDSEARQGAAEPPGQKQPVRPQVQQAVQVVDATGSFTFPTLAGSSDSPPTNSLSRTAPTVAAVEQSRAAASDVPRLAFTAAPIPGGTRCSVGGWSPGKLKSLNFFLGGTADARPANEPAASTEIASTCGLSRPYFNLTSMLRAGPGGLVSGSRGADGGVDTGGAVGASRAARFNPYSRPNSMRPPRPFNALPPGAQVPVGPAPSLRHEAGYQELQTVPKPSLAVATARLPDANPVPTGPNGAAPRPSATGHVRLAPGQLAFASGRTGTPLPKFGPMLGMGGGIVQHQQQYPAHTPATFRPLAGAAVGKRQREGQAASPLIASGIRNLSEFKRRRQAMQQQPRSVLAGLAAPSPRETTPVNSNGWRTPAAVGSGGSTAAATPGPPFTGGSASEVPTTETARRILETLDNIKRAGDANTPNILAGKAGLHSGARTGPPTGTAFPNMLLPPLDRLDQNHYGGTPTPSAATGGPGFVSGATPSQFAVTGAAGPTPGPRLVLEFNTPTACQPLQSPRHTDKSAGVDEPYAEVVANTLPLSPITVPQAASAKERSASKSVSAPAVAAEAPAPSRVDAWKRPGETVSLSSARAGSDAVAAESVRAIAHAAKFATPTEPFDPQLRQTKDLCEPHKPAVERSSVADVVFATSSVAVDKSTVIAAATASDTTNVDAQNWNEIAVEVAKAAAIPLPDDDDSDEEPSAEATLAVAPIRKGRGPSDGRTSGQATKTAPLAAGKRVGFTGRLETPLAEQWNATEQLAKDATTAQTPSLPATPGGFFISHAGSTPYSSLPAGATPEAAGGDKTGAASQKDAVEASRASPFSFGALSTVPAATTGMVNPFNTQPFGQGVSSNLFTSSAPPGQGNFMLSKGSLGGEASGSDKGPVIFQKPLTISASAATEATPTQSASVPVIEQSTFGASAAAAVPAALSCGAPAMSALGVPAAVIAPTTALSVLQSSTSTVSAVGAACQPFASSSVPTASSSAVPAFGSSAPRLEPSFGIVPTASSCPAVNFTFGGAIGGSALTSSSAFVPSTSSAAAQSFTFGGAQATAGSSFPSSFGSPMPVSAGSSGLVFGEAHASASAGFGAGGFGGFPTPAANFTFGVAANNAPAGGGSTTASNGGFGLQQQGSTNPASTFPLGVTGTAPAFGGSASAPSFGAVSAPAPAPQPTFGVAAPSYVAPGSTSPFGAAAPTFGAPTSQPTFGAATGSSTPAFGTSVTPSHAAAPNFGMFGGNNNGAPANSMFRFGADAPPQFSAQPAPAQGVFGMPNHQVQAPTMTYGTTASGVGAFGNAPAFGGAPQAPAGDAGGGFHVGVGDPRDSRKRVKARRHGH